METYKSLICSIELEYGKLVMIKEFDLTFYLSCIEYFSNDDEFPFIFEEDIEFILSQEDMSSNNLNIPIIVRFRNGQYKKYWVIKESVTDKIGFDYSKRLKLDDMDKENSVGYYDRDELDEIIFVPKGYTYSSHWGTLMPNEN